MKERLEDITKKWAEKLQRLCKDDQKNLYTAVSKHEISSSTRIVLEMDENLEVDQGETSVRRVVVSAILDGKKERTCYIIHNKYVYKAWVVTDNESSVMVDEDRSTSGNGRNGNLAAGDQ